MLEQKRPISRLSIECEDSETLGTHSLEEVFRFLITPQRCIHYATEVVVLKMIDVLKIT